MGVLDVSALGDALGGPYEFNEYVLKPGERLDWRGGTEHFGEWTDDTYMALAIAMGMVNSGLGGEVYDYVAHAFVDWSHEYPRGIGIQTNEILSKFSGDYTHDELLEASESYYISNPEGSAGNGSLMRIHPVSLLNISSEFRAEVAETITKLTHFDGRCCGASVYWVELLAHARLTGELDVYGPLRLLPEASRSYWRGVIDEALVTPSSEFSRRGWWVIPSLQQALSAVYHNFDVIKSSPIKVFEEIISAPASDSDTVCAIAGGLLGALGVGVENFPCYLNVMETLNGKWPELLGVGDLNTLEVELLKLY